MARLFDRYQIKRGDNLGDPEYWNRIIEDLDLRLHAREQDGQLLAGAVDTLTQVALTRLNDTFTPLIEQAQHQLSNVGARFVGRSSDSVTVGIGEKTWVLTDATRNSYVETDYVVVRPVDDPDIGLVGQTISYDRDNGLLTVEVVLAQGSGTFDDWEIRVSAPPDIEHASRTDNPHETTAAQVGAPTIAQMDAAIALAISGLLSGAPGALDTLNELAAALGNDANFATTVTNSLSAKLAKSANLSDVQNATTARNNLGAAAATTVADHATRISAAEARLAVSKDWVEVASVVASNSPYVTFTQAALFDGTYGDLMFLVEHLLPVGSSVYLQSQFSRSSSWVSAGYVYGVTGQARDNGTATGTGSGATSYSAMTMSMPFTDVIQNSDDASNGVIGRIELIRPGSNALRKAIHGWLQYQAGSAFFRHDLFSAAQIGNKNPIDGFRLFFSSGNVASGTVRALARKA